MSVNLGRVDKVLAVSVTGEVKKTPWAASLWPDVQPKTDGLVRVCCGEMGIGATVRTLPWPSSNIGGARSIGRSRLGPHKSACSLGILVCGGYAAVVRESS